MDCVFMAIYQIIHYLRILASEPGSRERTDFHVQPTSPRMFRFVRSDTVDVFVLCFVFAFASTKTWWRWWCIDWRVWSFEIGNWPGLIARGCGCIYVYTGCMLPFDFLYDTDMRIAYIYVHCIGLMGFACRCHFGGYRFTTCQFTRSLISDWDSQWFRAECAEDIDFGSFNICFSEEGFRDRRMGLLCVFKLW